MRAKLYKMAKKIEGLNAARVLHGYVWRKAPHESIKPELTKDNKIEIPQDEILKILMEFQQWQLEQINAESGEE